MPKEVRITVPPAGNIKMDMVGYEGNECFADSDALVKALRDHYGIEVNVSEIYRKPEAERAADVHIQSNKGP